MSSYIAAFEKIVQKSVTESEERIMKVIKKESLHTDLRFQKLETKLDQTTNGLNGLKKDVAIVSEKVEGLRQFITDGLEQQENNLEKTIKFFMKELYEMKPTEEEFENHEKRITILEQTVSRSH